MISAEDVSRETRNQLDVFAGLVLKWTPRINLISKKDQDDLWPRHIADSVQLAENFPLEGHWLDLGSGGGFPAIPVAIHSKVRELDTRFTLIESDARKSVFLRTAVRELGLNATVLTSRIEDTPPQNADVISARALAPLKDLLGYFERHASHGAVALFQKGARWENEVAEARKTWRFDMQVVKSETHESSVILKIEGVSRD